MQQQERKLKLRHTSAAHHALAMLRAHAQLGLPSASLPLLTPSGEKGEEKRPQEQQQKQSAPQEQQQQNHHLDHQQQQQRQQHYVHKKKSKINNGDNVVEPSSLHCGASDAISMKEVVTDSLVVKDEYSGLQQSSQQPHQQQQQQLSTIPPNVRLVGVRPVDSVPLSYHTSLPRRPLSSTIDVSFPVEIEPKPETELEQGQGEERVDTRKVKTQGTGKEEEEEEEDCTPPPSTPAQKKARQRARKEQLRQWRARQSRNSREERATARKRRNATKAHPADTKICSSNSLAAAVRREEQSLSHSQTRSVTFASTVEFHLLPTETI